jgi:hypothetical protein
VAAALDEVRPDAVLIEGAPELDAVVALGASPSMRPPVAGVVYAPTEPRRAAFYPLAAFSPEWVALRWALAHGVDVAFADLPAANHLADQRDTELPAPEPRPGPEQDPGGGPLEPLAAVVRTDPIAVLAQAAGFDDPERWWEDAVEHRHRGLDAFTAVTEAMAALRSCGGLGEYDTGLNARREAAMRRQLRAAAQAHEHVVFVCGAWHAPALQPDGFPPAAHDDRLLRGLAKVKVAATWVPWTNARLAYHSGYGAGVASPGWYQHLFTAPDAVSARWLTRTAHLLRDEQLDASSASVIEALRLADALAALRSRPLAGLAELTDATESVLCAACRYPCSWWPSASTWATTSVPCRTRRRWCRWPGICNASRSA